MQFNSYKHLAWLVLVIAAADIRAATLITGTFGGSGTWHDTDGYAFTVGSNPLEVYEVAVYDVTNDGLAVQNQLGLWTDSGTLLASKTFAPGTGAPAQGRFRWLSLDTPIILAANTTYRVAVYGLFEDRYSGFVNGSQVSDDITLIGAVRNNLTQFSFPNSDPNSFTGQAIIGPNLRYNVVPEPSAALLLISGLAALYIRRLFGPSELVATPQKNNGSGSRK